MPRLAKYFLLAFLCFTSLAYADTAEETRAHALFYEIRCVVCAGESIAESPADMAKTMRALIREQIAGGMSDEEIKAHLVSRYGDHILMRPPFNARTLLLWLAPLGILAAGAFLARRVFMQRGVP